MSDPIPAHPQENPVTQDQADPPRPPAADMEWGVGDPISHYASEEEARAVYGRCVATGQRVRLVCRPVGEWIEVETTHA